ncbi:MAG: hypothetical protein HY748_07040 [Elusimicrobia bacterium]|nr:hypothetical protein [Elusimicrobiota bacterium]
MAIPLSAVLLFAGLLAAQTPAVQPAPAPKAQAAAERAFEAKLQQVIKEAGANFLVLRPPPELPLPLDSDAAQRCAGKAQDYAILRARITFVQAGRAPEDDVAIFHRFIRKVAADLKVNPEQAVLLYGSLTRSGDAKAGDPLVENAVRAGFIAEILRDSKLTSDQRRRMTAKLDRCRNALGSALAAEIGAPDVDVVVEQWKTRRPYSAEELKKLPPRVQPLSMKLLAPPAVAQVPAKSGSVLSYLDVGRAAELASEAWEGAKRFMGKCYRFVKDALDSILPEGWRSEVGQKSAYQFAKSLNSNPKLFDRLKLRRVPVEELPGGLPPIGAIVVYGRSQCGFSPAHGHIEIVVSRNPPKTCSDGCADLDKGRLACIQKKGKTGYVNVYIPVTDSAPAGG